MTTNPAALVLALAYRKAADLLEAGTFTDDTCCGIEVDVVGRCQHRDYHATRTIPDISLIVDTAYPEDTDYRVIPPTGACEAPSGETYEQHYMEEITSLRSNLPVRVFCDQCGQDGTIRQNENRETP